MSLVEFVGGVEKAAHTSTVYSLKFIKLGVLLIIVPQNT